MLNRAACVNESRLCSVLCWFCILLRAKAQVLGVTLRPCLTSVSQPCWSPCCSRNAPPSLPGAGVGLLKAFSSLCLECSSPGSYSSLSPLLDFWSNVPSLERSTTTGYTLILSFFSPFILLSVPMNNGLIVCPCCVSSMRGGNCSFS